MKILQINKFHFPQGGADVHYLELSRLLQQKGHEVINFSMRHPQNQPSPFSSFFADQMDLTARKTTLEKVLTTFKFIYNRQAARRLEQLIRQTRPDIAHIHNIYHQLSPSILLVLKKYRIPVVMTAHDHKLICPNYGFYAHGQKCEHALGRKYYQCVIHKCVRNSYAASLLCALENTIHDKLGWYRHNIDLVITPSSYLKNTLEKGESGLKKITVLANFIDTTFWKPSGHVRKKQQLLFVGRLSPEKGIVSLLEAWQQTNRKNHQLIIIGSGPQENELKNLVREHQLQNSVIFLGRQEKEIIRTYYQESIATVLPSISPDVSPLAAAESLACGTPLIVSDQGGLPETVQHGEFGLIFPKGNKQKLQKTLEQAINKPEEMAQKAQKGVLWAKEHLSADIAYEKIFTLYQGLLQARRQPISSTNVDNIQTKW